MNRRPRTLSHTGRPSRKPAAAVLVLLALVLVSIGAFSLSANKQPDSQQNLQTTSDAGHEVADASESDETEPADSSADDLGAAPSGGSDAENPAAANGESVRRASPRGNASPDNGAPTTAPAPAPNPVPGPAPTPYPDPDPAPDPEPIPDPDPEPTPDPDPEPEPTPDPEPVRAAEAFTVVAAHQANVLTWETPSVGSVPAGFTIERSSAKTGPFLAVASVSVTTTVFKDPVTETGYLYYRVSSLDETRGITAPTAARRNDRVLMSEDVGPEGLTLIAANGEVELTLPTGALDATRSIGVSETGDSPRMAGALRLASTYDLSPDGLALNVPAKLRIAYEVPVSHFQVSATLEAALELMSYDPGADTWEAVPSSLVPGEKMLEGSVPHFSYWSGASIQPHGTTPTKTSYCSGICHNLVAAPGSPDVIPSRAKEVCYNCHGNVTSDMPPAGATGRNVEAEFQDSSDLTHTAGVNSRHPVSAGDLDCTSCHDIHRDPSGGYTYLLKSYDAVTGRSVASKPGQPVGTAFCWTCHGTKASARINSVVPGYWTRTGDKKTNLVGTPHEVIDAPAGTGIVCSTCHGAHGSPSTALITTRTLNGDMVTGNDQTLCLACHDGAVGAYPGEPIYTQTGHSTVTVSSKAATSWPSSASAAGSCQNCHDPHGTTNDSYLREASEDLCAGCHDVSGLTYPADYSYQGASTYSNSGHGDISSTLSWTTFRSDSKGFAAWEGDTAPTPTTPGVALSAAEVDALLSVDGDRAITNETGVTGESDYQVYRFNVNTDPATLRTMTVRWEGFGEALAGYPTSVHVWNETLASGAGAWEQLASGDWANLTEVKSTLTTPSNYVDEGGNVYLMARAVNAVDADILTGPTVAVLNDTTVQVTWTTRGAANSWVDFGATATYGSTVGTDVESVSHSVNLSIEPTATYHYRIRSEDRDGETDASTDRTFAVPAPKPVLLGNIGGWPAPVPVTFNWTMTDTTRAPYTYRVYVSGPNGYGYASPWLSGMSHTLSLDYGLHYWRVFAQDVNGTITALSAVDSFIVFDDSGSCPFLFSWDGEDFGWEGDLYTTGKLASPRAGGTYKKPNPNDYYVLDRDLVAVDGTLEMRLVEERVETDYMDTFQLYAIDLPTNRDIAAEKIPQGGIYEPLEDIVHTVDSAMSAPLSAVIVETGEDVLARIAAPDGDYAVLSPDVELPGYQSVELDLGDLSDAPAIKLLFEGMSRFPETPEGKALGTAGVRQKVEVIGADGEWMALPGTWPKPAEFARPYLLDLTGLFPTDDYRVRLTFLLKTYVDAVRLDTTANADYTVTQVPMASAELRRHGRDSKSSGGDVYEYVYDEPASIEDFDVYLPGAYTRFGEVSPLLAETDDKFVIYGAGDELALRFDELPDPAPGMHRRYVVYANGFYKDLNTDVPSTVEPLPFQAMSNYPYGADETYPDDAEHDKYRTEWNTRVVGEPPLMDPADFDQAPLEAEVSAVNTEGAARAPLDVVKSIFESIGGFVSDLFSQNVSDDAAFRTTHAPSALVSVRTTQPISSDVPRSLHTDFVALDITIDDVASAPGDCAVCHDVHGSPDENGLVRPGLVAEREDVLCTSAGDGACHSSAANSVSGVNVLDQFTTSSNNTRHHDVTENAQDATGASIRCSDCHNPHSDGEDARFVNPETPGQDYQKDVSDYVGPTGEVFAAVGSRHDALPPVISGHWIDLNTLGADQPIIRWTTDEMSTSWIEYGETTAYGTEDGTDSMSTAHAVTLSSVTTGTVYHYRIRITDVLGNTGYSADAVFTPLQPPNAPTLVPEPDIDLWWDPAPTLQCSTVTSPDGDSVQYYFDVWTGSTHYTSGWIAGTSWTTPNLTDFRTYTWTVQARDAGHTYAVSPPSAADTFYTFNTGSCPFLFSWDGESFGYEGDLYTTGKLASPRAGNTYKKPNPNDYYVLDRDLVPLDGALELRLVEERVETDYLDTFQLFAIDLPTNRDIVSEKIPQGGTYQPIGDILHTVDSTMASPLSAVHVETGEDVLEQIGAPDGVYAVLSPDVEQPSYQSIELDLGDLSDAPEIKLLFEGMSRFPDSAEGKALSVAGVRQKVEVIGTDGEWTALPGTWPKPAEFARPYLLDLTGLFPTDDYRVRLTFLLKTYVDSVQLDTTTDTGFQTTQVPMASAELGRHGIDRKSSNSDVYEYVYEEPAAIQDFDVHFPGAYTRFGEVSPLLDEADDMFVIYGAGDELVLRFDELPEPAPGTHRRYVVYANGFYKDMNTDVDKTVGPLPFQAMSNYPYGADESYPDDAEHNEYLAEWNTRVVSEFGPGTAASAEVDPTPSAAADRSENITPAEAVLAFFERVGDFIEGLFTPAETTSARFLVVHEAGLPAPVHYSVNTDRWIVALTDGGRSRSTAIPVSGWETTGTATPPDPSSPGSAVGAGELVKLTSVDSSYWVSDLAVADSVYNWQVAEFSLADDDVEAAREIAVEWTGYGEPSIGYPTTVYLWNFNTDAWEQVSSAVMGSRRLVAKIAQDPDDDYCLTCHDGTPPEGVVFPSSVYNVGPKWTSTFNGADLHGDKAGTGFGGGIRSGYSRGSMGLSCGACHESHGNDNDYHIASQVNGVNVTITNGNSYKSLCAACHTGSVDDWHRPCLNCHAWGDGHGDGPNSPEVVTQIGYPNASSDCSLCHSHGSRTSVGSDGNIGLQDGCSEHWCHDYSSSF